MAQTVAVGALLGLVSTLPAALLFERALKNGRTANLVAGLLSILLSFAVLTGSLLVARGISRDSVLPLGCAEVASMLVVWVVEAWRGWHDASVSADPEERK